MQSSFARVPAWRMAVAVVFLSATIAWADNNWVAVSPDGTVAVQHAGQPAPANVVVRNYNQAAIQLTVNTPGVIVEPRKTKGGEFVEVTWLDASFDNQVGAPAVPFVRRLFITPPGAAATVTVQPGMPIVIDAGVTGFSLPVMPIQAPVEKLPGALEQAPFAYDASAYGLSTDMPAVRARVLQLGIVRGQQLWMLEAYPVAYNPMAGTLTVWPEMEATIRIAGRMQQASTITPLPGLNDIVLNPDLSAPMQRGTGNYLIIVSSTYQSDIAAFAAAKQAQGFTVSTHVVSPGTSNSVIKSYIQGLWGTPDAPDYVLLVGDTNTIPLWVGGGEGTPNTDLQYVCMDGASDWYPDIAIGRFPVRSSGDIQDIVAKTLYFENGPMSDPDYVKRAVFMASEDNYTVSEGTHNWVINNYMTPNEIVSDKLYCHTYSATTQQVRNSFNDGRFYGIYSGHGSTTYWADGPYFTQSDVNGLTNADLYPFVCSFACLTGDFSYTECFMETWILAPNKGALTSLGSSVTSYWTEDDVLEKRLFDSIYDMDDDVVSEVGPVLNDTKMRYLSQMGSGSTTRRYFEMYNLMGDPSLKFPGACSEAGVLALDRNLYACDSSITIQVTDCGLNTDDGVVEYVDVTVASDSEPAGEVITLTETAPDSAEFLGVAQLSDTDSPGVVMVADGDQITVTYIDADNGAGAYDVPVVVNAAADCVGPAISAVQVVDAQARSATITFNTDESATGTIRYGMSCGDLNWSGTGASGQTSHSIELQGLMDNVTYYFVVDAQDSAGNVTTDDNGGDCYTFTTPDVPDYFTEQFEGNNDLNNISFLFTPNGTLDYYQACAGQIQALPTDPAGGTHITLSDDDYEYVSLSGDETVTLYGVEYSGFYVGSNGYITFDSGDTDRSESLSDHFEQPRISVLFCDLNPSQGGTISYLQLADRVAVTWLNVPEYYNIGENTLQVEMFFDGRIRMSYRTIDVENGLIGLSSGNGVPGDLFQTNFTSLGPCSETQCPGDLNGDGFRNVSDFTMFAAAFGTQIGDPNYDPGADMDGNGFINATDFTGFAAVYGTSCP